jgi:glycerol uptake facilitator protein
MIEIIGTAVLSLVVFSLTNPKNETMKDGFVPPIIGLAVGSLVAGIAPLTQACFNPARDLGPRLVSFLAGWKVTSFTGCWVNMFAPIIGCLIGGFIADKVLYGDDNE